MATRKKVEWVSGAELARRMEISRQRVFQLLKEGRLKRNKKKRFNYEKSRQIIEEARELARPSAEQFETLREARTALESYKAHLAELEYRQRTGELLARADVAEFCSKVIAVARQKLLSVPSKAAPEITGQKSIRKVKALIEREIHSALDELAKMRNVTPS